MGCETGNNEGQSYSLPSAPQLTINHDVAQDLDSSGAFEGPEKLLEVWFAPSPSALPLGTKENGLKSVPSDNWVEMLDMVNCKILSVVQSSVVDAYLLSESSMFVFPHKIILKTCGTTTLLLGLARLLRIAAVDAGFPVHNASSAEDEKAAATPYRVFYSRKNFLFPDRQRGPHRSWKQEVKYLDSMFEGGSAYMVGKMNGDHWYLYMTSPGSTALTPPQTPPAGDLMRIPTGLQTSGSREDDETLEVLMTDLDPENAKQFYLEQASALACKQAALAQHAREEAHAALDKGASSDELATEALTTEGHALGTVVSDTCGLSDVYPKSKYPDARIDAYMFEPCGFSANGVVPAPSDSTGTQGNEHYFTVHVTPEPNCSYASFETNVPGGQNGRETVDIIGHVVGIFKPGRFSVTLFEGKGRQRGENGGAKADQRLRVDSVPGYRQMDRIVHEFDDYDLVFRFYQREGWVGKEGARVGEDDL
ncbi:uncharacterized protein PgNI_02657 [Pyricularia grisea]|uniref:adenosylmethionine decarboxylase n=1 Tax=Pyricularia grisea TaxID=148305 RepID=A0A6P8BB06_PYRGI|nr:uncharacterized protein PgNI_02657 [Pyricularia grisea]TLD13010.1 hypothetical protein PgNI_02657 [Pyricularia grisea]